MVDSRTTQHEYLSSRQSSAGSPTLLKFCWLSLVAAACVGVGCGSPARELKINADVERPPKAAVIFFVDGMNRQTFESLLSAGELPNIASRFARGGTKVEHAIASLPSITYPNTVSLLTGLFPGHHGILDNQWFDRASLNYQNYVAVTTYQEVNADFLDLSVYDHLHEHFSVSINCPTHRGSTYSMDNMIPNGVDWILQNFEKVNERAADSLEQVVDFANAVKIWPTVTMYYFPACDEIAHRRGSDSSRYEKAMKHTDAQIGRICDALEKAGMLDSTFCVLVSDHGHQPTPRSSRLRLAEWIRKNRGLAVFSEAPRKKHWGAQKTYRELLEQMSAIDVIVTAGSTRKASIYLRGSRGWNHPTTIEERAAFVTSSPPLDSLPGVEVAAIRGEPGRIQIYSRGNRALIERSAEGGEKRYRVIEIVGDPLGWLTSPELAGFIAAGWHSSREWLQATATSKHPDFVAQIVEMFDSPRCGDVVLFASGDYSFDSKDAGGHGSCLATDMRVPFYFRGPGIPNGGYISFGRTVDLTPTIIDLLGQSAVTLDRRPMDGISLKNQLLHPTTKPTELHRAGD